MKATLTTISSSPVKEKASLIADHLFLLANRTWMWKGGMPAHPCWVTTFRRCKHIYHFSVVAQRCTSLMLFLTASLPRRRAPYLWDAAFHSASGCTGAEQEGITPGKKRPGRGPCLEDQNARNFTGLALPLLNHPSHENIELMNALIQMLQVQASDREPEVAAGDVKLPWP